MSTTSQIPRSSWAQGASQGPASAVHKGTRAAGRRPRPHLEPAPKTKQSVLIGHLCRKRGATIAELQIVTGWQAHSVRGALSGTLRKKLGLAVTSEKVEGRGRVYRIAQGA